MTDHNMAAQATGSTPVRSAATSQSQRFRAIMDEARRRLSAPAEAEILDIVQVLIAHPVLRRAVHDEIRHWGVRLVSAKQSPAQRGGPAPRGGDAHAVPRETD